MLSRSAVMSWEEPPFLQYEEEQNRGLGLFGTLVVYLFGGALVLAFLWPYVGPVIYTVCFILDFLIHLFDPTWPVVWLGDTTTYSMVVAGLTGLALAWGTYWLGRLGWRFVQFMRKD